MAPLGNTTYTLLGTSPSSLVPHLHSEGPHGWVKGDPFEGTQDTEETGPLSLLVIHWLEIYCGADYIQPGSLPCSLGQRQPRFGDDAKGRLYPRPQDGT